MKFAETPVTTQNTIYLRAEIREVLKVKAGDTLEWHITDQCVSVEKKEG